MVNSFWWRFFVLFFSSTVASITNIIIIIFLLIFRAGRYVSLVKHAEASWEIIGPDMLKKYAAKQSNICPTKKRSMEKRVWSKKRKTKSIIHIRTRVVVYAYRVYSTRMPCRRRTRTLNGPGRF